MTTGSVREARRLHSLDALRGLAALGVVAYHYLDQPAYYGLLGVELFFIISGFVILMTLERVPSLLQFAIGRAARLYPAYWFSVAVAGVFLLGNASGERSKHPNQCHNAAGFSLCAQHRQSILDLGV